MRPMGSMRTVGTMGTRPHHAGGSMRSARSHHAGRRRSPWGSPLLGQSVLQTAHSVLQLSDLKTREVRKLPTGRNHSDLPSVESPGSGAAGGDLVNADPELASPS